MSRLDAAAWLKHLDRARRVALEGKDPEGVHQVRVAARRLRVWLRLGEHPALQGDLRWLCRALSGARDLDVFGDVVDGPALGPLRDEAQEEVRRALDGPRWRGLRAALGRVRAPRRRDGRRVLAKLERRLAARRDELPRRLSLDALEAVHALRRALRTVRYAREWLGEEVAALAEEQASLGAVCDLSALRRFTQAHVPEAVAQVDAGLETALALLAAARPASKR